MPDPLSLDTYFTHQEEGHFFTYMYDTCTGANEATLIFYQYMCSKIGPFFKKLFLPFLLGFFSHRQNVRQPDCNANSPFVY